MLLPWFALKLPPGLAPALRTKPEGVRVIVPWPVMPVADAVNWTEPVSDRASAFKLTDVCPPPIDVVTCEAGPLGPFSKSLVPSPLVNVRGSPLTGAGWSIEIVTKACKFFPIEMLLTVNVPPEEAPTVQVPIATQPLWPLRPCYMHLRVLRPGEVCRER